jgi:hypothetical protein
VRVVIFCHSVSDWNHGNAHFVRGVATAVLPALRPLRYLPSRLDLRAELRGAGANGGDGLLPLRPPLRGGGLRNTGGVPPEEVDRPR